MKVTITEFRRNLFKLVERVMAGETVEFGHTNPQMTEKQQRAAEKKLQSEMWAEIEKD